MMLVLLECVVDQGGPGEISHDGRLDQGWDDIVQACGSQDPIIEQLSGVFLDFDTSVIDTLKFFAED